MADKHPYTGVTNSIVQAVNHLRKTLPPQITSDTLKKLAIAPNNESYLINILKFLNIIDNEGNRTKEATVLFTKHDDDDFKKHFSKTVQDAYSDLFSLHGDGAWALSFDDLISYFRANDQTSDIVGKRQASTFQTLAALGGHGEPPTIKATATGKRENKKKAPKAKPPIPPKNPLAPETGNPPANTDNNFGLTLRIEINLPVASDQKTYDMIFKSIRENLIDAKQS